MAEKRTVTVEIRGKQYRIRTDEDDALMQRVASYLDDRLAQVEERTGTVDTLDVALLTGLNLAREIIAIREGRGSAESESLGHDRLRALIELAESGLETQSSAH